MTPTEKRIYALAQKWAKTKPAPEWGMAYTWGKTDERRRVGRALLKLFKER